MVFNAGRNQYAFQYYAQGRVGFQLITALAAGGTMCYQEYQRNHFKADNTQLTEGESDKKS